MSRRYVYLLLLLALTLTLFFSKTLRADRSSSTITLRNSSWDHGAVVEVKRGKAQNAADNPNYGSKTLAKGESWSIPCEGNEVVWRRLAVGYPNETFTPWTRDSCFDDNTHDV